MLANGRRPRSSTMARGLFRQPAHVIQAKAHPFFAAMLFDGTEPIRGSDIDWFEMQAMLLRVFYKRGWRVETHRLVVENRRRERRQIMALQIDARISE